MDAPPTTPSERRVRRRLFAVALTLSASGLLAIWLVGVVLRDRYVWSQFLFWVPSSAVAALLLLAVAGLAMLGRRRAAVGFSGAALLLVARVCFVEHRPLRTSPAQPVDATSALRVLHCNLHWPSQKASPAVFEFSRARAEDLLIYSEPGWLLSKERGKALQEEGWKILRVGRYAVLSRLPVVEYRSLVSRPTIDVTLLRVDASERGMGVVTLALVDLPSTPSVGRMEMAQELRAMLDEVGAPSFDLVIGDTNLTRGSVALATIFPGLHNAWDDAGRGCGTSYPAAVPLWHIDQTLLGPALRAVDYQLTDIGFSQHRAQQVAVVATGARP